MTTANLTSLVVDRMKDYPAADVLRERLEADSYRDNPSASILDRLGRWAYRCGAWQTRYRLLWSFAAGLVEENARLRARLAAELASKSDTD